MNILPFAATPARPATILEPVHRMLEEMRAELKVLRSVMPASDVTAVTYNHVLRLEASLTAARDAKSISTVQELADRHGIPTSTLTDWANNYGRDWAEKAGSMWRIDTVRFDAWFTANRKRLNSRSRNRRDRGEGNAAA